MNFEAKVEKLIDMASIEKWLADNSVMGDNSKINNFNDRNIISYIPPTRLWSKAVNMNYFVKTCTRLKEIQGLDITSATSAQEMIRDANTLHTCILENTGNVTNWYGFGHGAAALKVLKTLDMTSATNTYNMLPSSVLETLLFVPNTLKVSLTIKSAVLSNESIQSIVDGIAYNETAQTLTLNTAVVEKLTAEQMTTISNKNWSVG